MANFKTPGVYIEEIPTLGSSIAGVPTAIMGFVGYTEKAIIDGTSWNFVNDGIAPPVRITSLLEFIEIFGNPFSETFKVTLTGNVPTPATIAVTPTSDSTNFFLSQYILFYQVQMFYANGGGACWVVAADSYQTLPSAIDDTKLLNGIKKLEQIDEVTILNAPESVFLTTAGQRKIVYNEMVNQCAKLQDRFALLDVVHNGTNTIFQDATDFRDNDIGADNLKYGGAYYPALDTPIVYSYKDEEVIISDVRTPGSYPFNYTYNTAPNNKLTTILNGTFAFLDIQLTGPTTSLLTAGDIISINIGSGPVPIVGTTGPVVSPVTTFDNITNIVANINNNPILNPFIKAVDTSTVTTAQFKMVSKVNGTVGNTFSITTVPIGSSRYIPDGQPTNFFVGGISADKDLYNRIKNELAKYTLELYPSSSMGGVYARVDGTRGVWKAPANVGLNFVNEPSIIIDDDSQENLNVDSVSGKSINAIRQFSGRGTLVWGARTLAGNDNEWRYVNVRRLFTYVEESCKKATEFVVFESNTAVTWNRVKNMIEAFLTNLWRDGALAGATTKDAFFVNVGLGSTMTPDDVLNGKMIVTIGMAAARPAEFIILQFEHKLQES